MDEQIPKQIDRYQIEDVLGRGGQSTVYRAYDPKHDRPVALKVLESAADAKQILRQFQVERSALGRMAHDCIAKLYDAGEENGAYWFALELVEGATLTEHCDADQLPLDDRLRLFECLCRGVDHAHGQGVLHRDLKPNNVLVQGSGPQATPKIIDLGIARGLGAMLFEGQVPTVPGRFLGTPYYASPEQVRQQPLDVGADIYSLGVILHELLVGALPMDAIDPAEIGYEAFFERLLQPVRKPSVRLRQLDRERAEDAARARGTTVDALDGTLVGDLDSIVLKATDDDPQRRYASAREFAEDIRNFLAQLPVSARPHSLYYRTRKFVSRNRWPVAVGAAVFGLLTATSIYGVVGIRQARENTRLAEERALEAEGRQRDKAEAFLESGDFLLARGSFEAALADYAQAESLGFDDRVELGIRRIRALDGLRRYPEAVEVLDSIDGLPAAQHERATLLLLCYDLVGDEDGDPGSGRALVEEALRLDAAGNSRLEPADRAYATGMLSPSVQDALAHFREARSLNPFHRRANDALAVTLLVLGYREEARRLVEVVVGQSPDDVLGPLYLAAIEGLSGRPEEADNWIEQIHGKFGEADARLARLVVDVLLAAHDLNYDLRKSLGEPTSLGKAVMTVLSLTGKLEPLIRELQDGYGDSRLAHGGQMMFRLPACVVESYRPLIGLFDVKLGGMAQPDPRRRQRLDIVALSKSAEDSGLLAGLAIVFTATGRAAEAADSLLRAAPLPSAALEPETRWVQISALAAILLQDEKLDPERKAALRELALETLEKQASSGKLLQEEFFPTWFAAESMNAPVEGELALQWLRRFPGDAGAQMATAFLIADLGMPEQAKRVLEAIDPDALPAGAERIWEGALQTGLAPAATEPEPQPEPASKPVEASGKKKGK